jgi:hypothetical protein
LPSVGSSWQDLTEGEGLMHNLISMAAFRDELVKIAGGLILPKPAQISEGVSNLKRLQRFSNKIGRPGIQAGKNILGGNLVGPGVHV